MPELTLQRSLICSNITLKVREFKLVVIASLLDNGRAEQALGERSRKKKTLNVT